VAAAGALGVISVNGAAADGADRIFHEAGFIQGVSMNRNLHVEGIGNAQTAVDLAVSLCQRGQDLSARFQSMIASGAVKAKAGESSAALSVLEKIHTESVHRGYLPVEMESSLFIGRIEMDSGKVASGRLRLENLGKIAKDKNFNLIARQAENTLASSGPKQDASTAGKP